jgi:hypothetical protein
VSTDIVESAAFAYLEVINRVIRRREATGEVAAMKIALGNP